MSIPIVILNRVDPYLAAAQAFLSLFWWLLVGLFLFWFLVLHKRKKRVVFGRKVKF